tara:strand:+ start:7907 stop:8164 length:258 start_codon:yes stop_codon:yes gene_type:complete
MGVCSFCQEQEKESYWQYYCVDCANLRRMLVLHNPKKCVDILRRCLIRNEEQVTNKIKIELKNEANKHNEDEKNEYYLRKTKDKK